MFTWDHHGIGEKIYSNDSGQLFFNLILSVPGAGAFSGDFTTNLARQCRAFSRALKIEKLKDPLFRGPEGARATNDWCISRKTLLWINILNDLSFTIFRSFVAIILCVKASEVCHSDLFTPTHLAYFLRFWAPNYALQITVTKLRP